MKRAREVFWLVNYLEDIRADFFAIYHIPDWDYLEGPLFISLVERLPLYEGALQARIRLENTDEDIYRSSTVAGSSSTKTTREYEPGQTMTIAEALSGGDRLRALQDESVRNGGGDLFEIKKG